MMRNKNKIMFKVNCFIRKNSLELQTRLKELGYSICPCTIFDGAIWLSNNIESSSVHGKGFIDNSGWSGMDTQDKALAVFLYDAQKDGYIDCGDNEELFIALAAMRDDTDKNQWFVVDVIWVKCSNDMPDKYIQLNGHKATPDEIIKHFTRIFELKNN
jgi:hypothetical protein